MRRASPSRDAHAIATTRRRSSRHASRDAFDAALSDAIDAREPDLVVLAGFMRVLSDALVERHAGRMLNIHPSLLPAYPGLHTHRRAIADGARIHGCTVHFVTPAVDAGPIVAQAAVPGARRTTTRRRWPRASSPRSTGCCPRPRAGSAPAGWRWTEGGVRLDGRPVTDGALLTRLHGAT